MIDDLTQFIEEFLTTLSDIHVISKQACTCININFNFDLLQLHLNTHYNTFYDKTTAQGFPKKITRSTRSVKNSHTLIDNMFANNLSKRHYWYTNTSNIRPFHHF